MQNTPKADFSIAIDFEKGTESPARVFRAMSTLIETCQEIDRSLARSIDVSIEPVLLLEDVEAGSIKAWLTTILKSVDDEGLKNLDWKSAVGNYLVRAKYRLINFMDGKTEISDYKQIEGLKGEILEMAKETNALNIPTYQPIQTSRLIEDLDLFSNAIKPLVGKDVVTYSTEMGSVKFNLEFNITPESVEDLVTKETIESTSTMILVVKKPDYLGESMWEVRHGSRAFLVKINDLEWLEKFQNREIEVRPGDGIRAIVKTRTHYDYEGEVLREHYEVSEVLEVTSKPRIIQISIPEELSE